MDMTNLRAIPFSYVVISPTLAANSTGVATLRFQADSRFELHYFLAVSSEDDPADVAPNNFSVLVKDMATGRELASQRVPQSIFSGSAFNSSPELRSPLFLPQTDMSFDFLNLTGNSLTVTVVLKGVKFLFDGQS